MVAEGVRGRKREAVAILQRPHADGKPKRGQAVAAL
jgi:hypothetical protein